MKPLPTMIAPCTPTSLTTYVRERLLSHLQSISIPKHTQYDCPIVSPRRFCFDAVIAAGATSNCCGAELKRRRLMNEEESLNNLSETDEDHREEWELFAFVGAVKELFGTEQARI